MRLHCFGKSEAALEITRGGVAPFFEKPKWSLVGPWFLEKTGVALAVTLG